MKKLILFLCTALMMVCALCTVTYAYEHDYVYKCVEFPDGQSPKDVPFSMLKRYGVRFADTQKTIALTGIYEGKLWALIHESDKDRPVEAFVSEEPNFADYDPNNEDSYHFLDMTNMYYRGVIQGNQYGEALPD